MNKARYITATGS